MMSKIYPNSLKFKVLDRVKQLPGNVVLRQDVSDMGDRRQISRALQALVEMGELAKIGYGIYAKTYFSTNLNQPVIKAGFDMVCIEALNRLGVKWEFGQAQKAYNAGESTQVPVRTIVHLNSRYRGHLAYGNRTLIFEENINAR